MSKKDGGPALEGILDMSLRDYFAARANIPDKLITEMIEDLKLEHNTKNYISVRSILRYIDADAMLKARKENSNVR